MTEDEALASLPPEPVLLSPVVPIHHPRRLADFPSVVLWIMCCTFFLCVVLISVLALTLSSRITQLDLQLTTLGQDHIRYITRTTTELESLRTELTILRAAGAQVALDLAPLKNQALKQVLDQSRVEKTVDSLTTRLNELTYTPRLPPKE
jgi:hypothetical protein